MTEHSEKPKQAVAIAAIVAGAIVLLGCIAACTVTMYVFLSNPPW
jgi:hypothetical protein